MMLCTEATELGKARGADMREVWKVGISESLERRRTGFFQEGRPVMSRVEEESARLANAFPERRRITRAGLLSETNR